ncbi:MAG: OmpH family outer membrane protein [Dictyoglomus sp.]|nr:OmpH family outer membrane protein [Dictyoglomus sp.]MCX7942815.1 OmpH family outer membrane protein [Dictyoglomaceae bacterium]MDW8188377.1 OmpH family outer membrane protein [Dictyoglomus sp.]
MRIFIYLILFFLFVVLFFNFIYSQSTSIGYIDYLKVFSEYKETKELQIQIQKKQAEINKIIEEAKKKGLDQKKLDELKREKDKELGEVIAKIRDTLRKKILLEVEKVAKSKNLSIVLEKSSRVWGGVDITKEVLENLNK